MQSKILQRSFFIASHSPIGAKNSLPVLCVSPVTPFYPACRSQTHFSASVDDNECQNVTNICGQRGNCTNTPGSYYCTCLPGYKSTGKTEFQPNDGTECNGRINDTSEVVFPLAHPAGVSPATHAFYPPLTFLASADERCGMKRWILKMITESVIYILCTLESQPPFQKELYSSFALNEDD